MGEKRKLLQVWEDTMVGMGGRRVFMFILAINLCVAFALSHSSASNEDNVDFNEVATMSKEESYKKTSISKVDGTITTFAHEEIDLPKIRSCLCCKEKKDHHCCHVCCNRIKCY